MRRQVACALRFAHDSVLVVLTVNGADFVRERFSLEIQILNGLACVASFLVAWLVPVVAIESFDHELGWRSARHFLQRLRATVSEWLGGWVRQRTCH